MIVLPLFSPPHPFEIPRTTGVKPPSLYLSHQLLLLRLLCVICLPSLATRLLDVKAPLRSDLVRTLYGILMLLPQSNAYKTLSDRLATVSALTQDLAHAPQSSSRFTR